MKGKRFLLFPNHLRLLYSNLKSSALLLAFHCSRHSFATNQLTAGTDITTVSKMLGHSDLKTTMIYAKVVDNVKREAADRVKLKF